MPVLLAHSVPVSKIGHGLMFMTWTPQPVSDEQCFSAIKDTVEAQPEGVKAFLNAGAFYSHDLGPANLELVARFFTKYPQLADKAFISVKGGTKGRQLVIDGSEENIRRCVDEAIAALDGKKRMDLYQCARVDRAYPIEDQVKVLSALVKEGKFDYIGLSEVTEEDLRRAHAVHPIAAIEVQVSPVHYPPAIKAVIKAAKELGVAVAAYSPVGHGLLTNKGIDREALHAEDMRHRFLKTQDENQAKFKPIMEAFNAFADKKGITVAQAAIAWVAARGDHVMPLPGSSHVQRTQENRAAGGISISEEDLKQLDAVVGDITFDYARA
ncbi:aldo/keto reductase [Auricularia subglabra TFB-10046 SS5]|nr:aldo/keto reductase [Auricularia subglabra TFB-10046 SS5]